MYSCAYFGQTGLTLYQAQKAKLNRICQKLELGPSDHVMEIGTGWGGFAIHAATQYGCRVTTTTISDEQFDLAGTLSGTSLSATASNGTVITGTLDTLIGSLSGEWENSAEGVSGFYGGTGCKLN